MSGREEQQLTSTGKAFSISKTKLVVGTILTVLAVTAVVCIVAVGTSLNSNITTASGASVNQRRSVKLEEPDEALLLTYNDETVNTNKRARRSTSHSRFSRQALPRGNTQGYRNPNSRIEMSCVSHPSNHTVPAAHIKGHGGIFGRADGSSGARPVGYQQRWKCLDSTHHSAHAFVDGGMTFNQTDQSLRVPTCGYYHVFSQILFELKPKDSSDTSHTTVYHLLKFERNCPDWYESTPVAVMGRTSINAGNTTTTYTGDVIKLCAGGRIRIEIPENQNHQCFPTGDENGTFLGAVLVAKTTCHWPPTTTMDNFNNEEE